MPKGSGSFNIIDFLTPVTIALPFFISLEFVKKAQLKPYYLLQDPACSVSSS